MKEKYSGKGVPVIWIRPMSTTPVKDAGYRGKWSVVRGLQLTLVEEQRHPCTMRLLPSSSSLAVGASKQIMFGGCLALRRSLWTSCKLRRSFVVSSNFCWMFRASVWGKENTQRVNTSSEFLQLPSGNPPSNHFFLTQYSHCFWALTQTPGFSCYINTRRCRKLMTEEL